MARWPIPFVVACIVAPLAFAQEVKRQSQSASANAATEKRGGVPSSALPASAALAIADSLKRIAAAQDAQAKGGDSAEEKQDKKADLRAQEDMAYWARWMFFANLGSLAFTIAATVLLAFTFKQTRRATYAARQSAAASKQAVRVSRHSAEQQLRAYVGVKHGFIRIVNLTNSTRGLAELKIVNCGQTIAHNVRLVLQVDVRDDESIAPHTASIDTQGIYLLPGFVWDVDQATPSGVDIADFATDISKRRKHILVWGEITYETLGGTKTSKFRFKQGLPVPGEGDSPIGWNVVPTAGGNEAT